jgi:hypothetical protein
MTLFDDRNCKTQAASDMLVNGSKNEATALLRNTSEATRWGVLQQGERLLAMAKAKRSDKAATQRSSISGGKLVAPCPESISTLVQMLQLLCGLSTTAILLRRRGVFVQRGTDECFPIQCSTDGRREIRMGRLLAHQPDRTG